MSPASRNPSSMGSDVDGQANTGRKRGRFYSPATCAGTRSRASTFV